MSRKWPGSLITKTKVTPAGPYQGGAASGVWTLSEALQWTAKDLWPLAGNTFTPVIFIGGSGTNAQKIEQVNQFIEQHETQIEGAKKQRDDWATAVEDLKILLELEGENEEED